MTRFNDYYKNYIDGAWVDGGAGRIEVTNPGTGAVLTEHALANASDVDRAVQAAKRVHESGVLTTLRPVERGRMVKAMGQYILDNDQMYAEMLSEEQGKPLWEALIEIRGAARYFEYYGNQAETVEGKSIPLGDGYIDYTVYEPYGVTAHIIPWNYPVEMAARSVSAALTTGNTIVVKSAEMTPVTSMIWGHAAEAAGLPKGAVNVLCGYGHEAGAALAGHPDVRQVVFTGSVATGTRVAEAAAKNVVPCVLELGGKSAAIVHDDADLDAFERDIRWGIFFNAGQVCSAMSRVIVHESRKNELVDRAVAIAQSLSVGPGIDRPEFGANMGSMVSEQQRDRALGLIAGAVDQGATVATGGHALNIPGAFLEPTIISDVTPHMTIAQEEVFGPVMSVLSFKDEEEAHQISNSTEFGLVGGVFTKDLGRATRATRAIRAGQIFVNEWYAGGVETPFGGFGKSGYGREKGREALWNYVQTKNVAIKMS
ncbi:aldehyde dehydrogenase (NAD+) [Cognatiyoonia sediminum]|uniref:Aldehyde dehydrogenase (NAD+) n=1 Tax=Cognatiyoonia sediminum TaxID=1508389 RepID=A0A1M5N9P9_9RHOB|nr:aldehyde dehydrogenase family protein [Cognatiyoonia sediminum]SHG86316.1 aldehyde dehydrogenase (NAD+) [Cognatiyoonia sediminum]